MTEEEVYNLYGIEFINKVMKFYSGKEIYKKIHTPNGSLYRFLNNWDSAHDINKNLLPLIEKVINNPQVEETSEVDTELVELNHLTTKIWYTGNPHKGTPSCSLPTDHFKIIVIGWRNFLLTPPLDGTNVFDFWDKISHYFKGRN